MKRHRNSEEKKTKKPLSIFGQLLEKAVAKPVEENKPSAKLEQKETAQKNQPPALSPVKSSIVQSNAHLTHKLGDAARVPAKNQTVIQSKPTNKSAVQNQNNKVEAKPKLPISKSANSSSNFSEKQPYL